MQPFVHLAVDQLLPASGGLEQWALSFATSLGARGIPVVVHVVGDADHGAYNNRPTDFTIEILADIVRHLSEPVRSANWPTSRVATELWRFNYLALLASITRYRTAHPDATHVVVSTFITGVGFTAACVCETLDLPHLPCVVGTDFTRGWRHPQERQTLEHVAQRAFRVVAWNGEQHRAIAGVVGSNRVITIHTSLDTLPPLQTYQPPVTDCVSVFSDCGYSHKKASHLLMKAVLAVAEDGVPISLSLFGPVANGQSDYWLSLRRECMARHPETFRFGGFLPIHELEACASQHHLYASATFGEGCSLSRVRALCAGLPVVTTNCGEIPDVANNVSHVRCCSVGDISAFEKTLRCAVADIRSGTLEIDVHAIMRWRQHFSQEREMTDWISLLAAATSCR